MRVPIVGLLSAILTAVGGYSLYWYHNLSRDEQEEADRLACDHSLRLYGKGLDRLTNDQLGRIQTLVKGHFDS